MHRQAIIKIIFKFIRFTTKEYPITHLFKYHSRLTHQQALHREPVTRDSSQEEFPHLYIKSQRFKSLQLGLLSSLSR